MKGDKGLDPAAFATLVRDLRKERGLTQVQLAQELGTSQRQISICESSHAIPTREMLEKLGAYFHIAPEEWEIRTSKIATGLVGMQERAETVGQRIRVMRVYFRRSQAEFAKELGISQSMMSSMESDYTAPTYDVLCQLGKMGFSLHWIMYGETEQNLSATTVLEENATVWEIQKINVLLSSLPRKKIGMVRKCLEVFMKEDTKDA